MPVELAPSTIGDPGNGSPIAESCMNPDLERLVAADEEGRAGLETVRGSSLRALEALREEFAAARAARRRQLEEDLERQLAAIRTEAEELATQRRRRREEDDGKRRAEAESLLPRATELFVRLVSEGPRES